MSFKNKRQSQIVGISQYAYFTTTMEGGHESLELVKKAMTILYPLPTADATAVSRGDDDGNLLRNTWWDLLGEVRDVLVITAIVNK
jgi:hypothetical protein